MRRAITRLAGVLVLALAAALFATAALAGNGNGNGNGNGGTPPGQAKKQDTSSPASPPPSSPSTSSSSSSGIKPSNTTDHNTSCTTGGGQGTSATCTSSNPATTNADASKSYGNGKTAAQIANSHGSPAGTQIKGPGNSQPHKVTTCDGKTKDVHAVKSYPTCPAPAANSTPAPVNNAAPTANTVAPPANKTSPTVNTASSASNTSPTVGVLGATAALKPKASRPASAGVLGATRALKPKAARAGVLGTIHTIGRAHTLPFTGFPVWEALLAGLAMLFGGALLRRRTAS